MSLIHLALLAKAADDQRRRTAARRASSKKNESKKNNSSSYHDSNTVGPETFLKDLLANDPEATKLFLLLKDCRKQIDDEDEQKSLEVVQEVCARYEEQYVLLKKEIDNLEKLGITLDRSKILEKFYCSVKVAEGHGYGGYGCYNYNPARYSMGFNGMPLTKEMIENNTNQFQINLDKFNDENPNLDEQLAEVNKKISKQKKKMKYSPFNKEKKQAILTELLKVKNELTKKIEQRTILEEQSKNFAGLTPEQKKAILAYMEQVANCIVVGEELTKAIHDSSNIKHYGYGNTSYKERNVGQRMLESAVKQSDFTLERIEEILSTIKATMEENRVGYNSYTRLVEKSYTTYPNPTSPESIFAKEFFDRFYQPKNKTKSKK